MTSNNWTALHIGDTVEEAATKRRGKLDEAPQIATDSRRWRVMFSDGGKPRLKYFPNEGDLILISCPHRKDNEARFVPKRGIGGRRRGLSLAASAFRTALSYALGHWATWFSTNKFQRGNCSSV